MVSHTKETVGVDIDEDAVLSYNEMAFNQGILPEEMRAILVRANEDPDLGGKTFDVVVVRNITT